MREGQQVFQGASYMSEFVYGAELERSVRVHALNGVKGRGT